MLKPKTPKQGVARGNGVAGRWLGHGHRALVSGISVLIKRKLSCSFSPCEDTVRSWSSATQKRALTRPWLCSSESLDSSSGLSTSRMVSDKLLLLRMAKAASGAEALLLEKPNSLLGSLAYFWKLYHQAASVSCPGWLTELSSDTASEVSWFRIQKTRKMR